MGDEEKEEEDENDDDILLKRVNAICHIKANQSIGIIESAWTSTFYFMK